VTSVGFHSIYWKDARYKKLKISQRRCLLYLNLTNLPPPSTARSCLVSCDWGPLVYLAQNIIKGTLSSLQHIRSPLFEATIELYSWQNFILDKSSPEGSKRNQGKETKFYSAYILITLLSPLKILLRFNRTDTLLLFHVFPARVEAYHILGRNFPILCW